MMVFGMGGNPPPPGDITWYKAHALAMYAAFAILFPMGVFGVRYARYHPRFGRWFQYHWALQTFGVCLTCGGISIALRKFENCDYTTHRSIGFTLTFFILVQPILALFRPERGCDYRRCWEFVHWFLGTGGIILGWVNIFKGLDLYFVDWPGAGSQTILTTLFAFQVTIIGFAYLLFDKCHRERPDGPDCPTTVPLLNNASRAVEDKQFLIKV